MCIFESEQSFRAQASSRSRQGLGEEPGADFLLAFLHEKFIIQDMKLMQLQF